MSQPLKESKAKDSITDNCTACGACRQECLLLEEIGEDPTAIARRDIASEEAFSCSLCQLCQAVCPEGLYPGGMFAEGRAAAIEEGCFPIADYRYLFPDRKINSCSLYREKYGISYDDLPVDREAQAAFFPGCTLLTYSPRLTRASFLRLQSSWPSLALLLDCCGKPLYQMGLVDRGSSYTRYLKEKLAQLGVKSLITACPNCYYQLKGDLEAGGVEVKTVYEAWRGNPGALSSEAQAMAVVPVTVHDSCPDRFEGIFGAEARRLLRGLGLDLKEMAHNRKETLCCGSGGQVTHFRPELAEAVTKRRLEEAEASGAEMLVGYCLSCVLNFAKFDSSLKVKHLLNLVLGVDEDYARVKSRAQALFEGPEGEENWERLMADDNQS